jgi:hypothetical protein
MKWLLHTDMHAASQHASSIALGLDEAAQAHASTQACSKLAYTETSRETHDLESLGAAAPAALLLSGAE